MYEPTKEKIRDVLRGLAFLLSWPIIANLNLGLKERIVIGLLAFLAWATWFVITHPHVVRHIAKNTRNSPALQGQYRQGQYAQGQPFQRSAPQAQPPAPQGQYRQGQYAQGQPFPAPQNSAYFVGHHPISEPEIVFEPDSDFDMETR